MKLSPDVITLGVPDVQPALDFYTATFSPAITGNDRSVTLDLHGTGTVALEAMERLAADAGDSPATAGFRGYTLNYTVEQPSEVESVLAVAEKAGATVLKPVKKSLFAGVSAVFQAPDGSVWKLAAPTRKDTGPAGDPPMPTEVVAILGVAEPKVSRDFYTALGMEVDRDYGNKFIDFQLIPGQCRLGLMTRKSLAKDAGIREGGTGFRAAAITHNVESREDVNAVLAAAEAAGGKIAVAARDGGEGDYAGYVADPDGFLWKVVAR